MCFKLSLFNLFRFGIFDKDEDKNESNTAG